MQNHGIDKLFGIPIKSNGLGINSRTLVLDVKAKELFVFPSDFNYGISLRIKDLQNLQIYAINKDEF